MDEEASRGAMGPVQEGSVITVSLSPLKWEEHESFIEYLLCTRTLYIRCHSRYASWVLHPFYRWYLRLHSCTCHVGSKWQSCGLLVCVRARVLYKCMFMCWREKRGLFLLGNHNCHLRMMEHYRKYISPIQDWLSNLIQISELITLLFDSNSHLFHMLMS